MMKIQVNGVLKAYNQDRLIEKNISDHAFCTA